MDHVTAELADPIVHFEAWMAEAEKSEPNDPNAMALATADAEGRPSLRMVLLKGIDAGGFVFYIRISRAARGPTLPPIRMPHFCFTGSRCAVRCGSRARSSR
jgi:pyridoxamine 5'-phosphate oxidase